MCKSGKNGFWKTSIQLKNNQKLKIPHTIRNLDSICISNLISPGIDISSKNFFLDDLSIPKSHKEPITISTKSQYVEIDELDAKFCNKFLFNFKNTYELCINAFNTAKHLCFNNKFIIGNSLKSLRIKNRILHPEYLVLNENLESLYIQELKSCKNLKLNSNLKKLEIYYLKTAYGLILNDNLEKLILPNITTAYGLTLNDNLERLILPHLISVKNLILNEKLKFLKLDSLVNAKNLKLNEKLEILELNGIENGEGLVFNDKLRIVQFKSLKTAKNLILPRSIEKVIIPKVPYLSALRKNHPKAQFIILK